MPAEIIAGAVIGAAVASKPVRGLLRKGLVYAIVGYKKTVDCFKDITKDIAHDAEAIARPKPEPKDDMRAVQQG
jgi:hypothetical protein